MSLLYIPANSRGASQLDWLTSRFSFSFANYHDPSRMGFGPLRVINDDIVAPRQGFGMHGHQDMEIITIVLEGVVEHRDNLGNAAQIQAGEIQIMHAGTGILHSEVNPGKTPLKLLQIWIIPNQQGLNPGYETFQLPPESAVFHTIPGIIADAKLSYGVFDRIGSIPYSPELSTIPGSWQGIYCFCIDGKFRINGVPIGPRDAIQMDAEDAVSLAIDVQIPGKLLVFELGKKVVSK